MLTTASLHPRDSFKLWYETIRERIVPVELTRIGDRPFEGLMEGADVGSLPITRITQSAIQTEATPNTIRRHNKHDTVSVTVMLSGRLNCTHYGRESVQHAGEFVVLDRKPTIMATVEKSQSLVLEVSRARLERSLGPAALYAGLTIGCKQASTSLVTSFFQDLIRHRERFTPDTAERMSSIGIDLLVASIAERLAQETPRNLAGTVIVQRAKAYIEANLGDPTLDPSQLAIAMGVSLRRLQQLFREQNRNISDWIWKRRLETAALRLADSSHLHLPIGVLAYGCGFISQSHFSRCFKARYGMAPREYRDQAARSQLRLD
ncbi:AraC-like DNA-binding protein [Methylobacterium brachiatum]|uniref:AraC-like DNA-binding protein n=1 Tax=Methylobacterium brachiatum TaxID=269660 RepID=A0AAJ1WWI8_9HYPH|nr:AraC-like DNA-binding protein [Methylobacterium brachiatum]